MQKVPKHHVIAQGLIMRIKKTFDALHPSQKKKFSHVEIFPSQNRG